jgi:16S rRNA (cytosine967-C5)-methyltransferase
VAERRSRRGAPEEGTATRALAALALGDVLAGRSNLPEAFARHAHDAGVGPRGEPAAARDRAFARELAWGAARLAPRLDHLVRAHLRQAPRRRDMDVHALLLVGAYQLGHTAVPPHAAVHATVAATELLGKRWARGLVNAVLRKVSTESIPEGELPDEARFAHPAWLLDRLRYAWPEHWEAIAAAGNGRPPFTLRAVDPTASAAALESEGLEVRRGGLAAGALYVSPATDVRALPGFAEGALSVQDEGAQLAAELLDPQGGERVLDACAAPGGKTLHLAQRAGRAELVAVESDGDRAPRIRENLERGGLACALHVADAIDVDAWWDGRSFDRILLDAPCSATGILRRQPDVRLLRRDDDIAKLATLQRRLVDALWPLLSPGGVLLYCTCSVLPEEGPMIVQAFADAHRDAIVSDLSSRTDGDRVLVHGPGIQLLPTTDAHDGFFYARLERRRA